jgi:hypothetical protein
VLRIEIDVCMVSQSLSLCGSQDFLILIADWWALTTYLFGLSRGLASQETALGHGWNHSFFYITQAFRASATRTWKDSVFEDKWYLWLFWPEFDDSDSDITCWPACAVCRIRNGWLRPSNFMWYPQKAACRAGMIVSFCVFLGFNLKVESSVAPRS